MNKTSYGIKTAFSHRLKSINDIDEHKNNSKSKINNTSAKGKLKKKILSETLQNFKNQDHNHPLPTISNFMGFYYKNFDLNNYKKEKDESRSRSKSPERKYQPHSLKGNGIPTNLLERTKFLTNIFKSKKFQTFYNEKPNIKKTSFDDMVDYIVSYRKKNSELESAMMAYYFVAHVIKYDLNAKAKKTDNKYSQKPEAVFESGRALSIGFTNIFEHLLKKLEIKYKHIDGYCKLFPQSSEGAHIYSHQTNLLNNSPSKEKDVVVKNVIKSPSANSLNKAQVPKKSMLLYNEEVVNHCWNAIFLKGEWYFVDVLLGSGGRKELKNLNIDISDIGDSDFYFNPFYFMTPPHILIQTHHPLEDGWQFTDKTLTFRQFINRNYDDLSQFYKGIYQHNNIELLTHSEPIIKIKAKDILIIKLRLKNSVLGGDLYTGNGREKITEIKYTYEEKTDIFILEPSFPSNGDYIIRITSRPLTSTDLLYWPLLDYIVKVQDIVTFSYFDKYRIKATPNHKDSDNQAMLPRINSILNKTAYQPKIITDYLNVFPSKSNKKICYDDEGFLLLEPKTIYLKKGATIKFKVRIKGVLNVVILDGNQWFYLKKSERNTYEGEKEIKTDNVCICCLRYKNLFTEVFRFKPLKEKTVDSKIFMIKIKKKKNK